MTLGKKIRILRENREWTQAVLAEKLSVSPDTVQKWEVEKNTPPLEELKNIAIKLDTTIGLLSDDVVEFVESLPIGQYEGVTQLSKHPDSLHQLLDAGLRKGAVLHRFENYEGVPFSSICIGTWEIWSCERGHEKQMVDAWNEDCPI